MKPRIVDLVKGIIFALLCISISLRSHAQTKVISAGGSSGGGGGSGTVESVAATVPAYMTLTGSPITTTGTLAFGFATQAQGTIFAGPCTGAGAVTFRALCAADIPSLAPSKITGTAVIDSDARLTNARTPTAHASAHAAAGSDAVTLTQAQVTNLVSDLAGKQASGNYITALTGDVVAAGPGSVSATIQANAVALGTDTTGGYAGSSTEGGAATSANALNSATTTVDVSSATAPTSGQVLTATSGTAATWQTPSSGGVTSLNSLTGALSIAAGTSGADFAVSPSGSTITLNLPDASATARGAVTAGTQTLAGAKTFSSTLTTNGVSNSGTLTMVTGDVQFNLLTQKVNIAGAAHYQADASSNAVINSYGEIDLKPGAISSGTGRGTRLFGANGAYWFEAYAMELITLSTSGTTTDSSANLLPANSIIQGVTCRVTTTITTATDWSVGDPTTAARFSSANVTLTAGTTSVGLNHHAGSVSTDAAGPTQATAAKLRITTTGTPGAGAVRCTVFYSQFSPPTS